MNSAVRLNADLAANTLGDALVAALVIALEPLVRRVVAEAIEQAKLVWRWRTPEQAGELLGITPAAVRQRIRRGQLPGVKLDGHWFVDVAELDRQIQERRLQCIDFNIHKWGERRVNGPAPGHRRY